MTKRKNRHQTNGRLDKNGKRVRGAFGNTPKVFKASKLYDEAVVRLNECLEARALYHRDPSTHWNPDGQLRKRRPHLVKMNGRRAVKHGR